MMRLLLLMVLSMVLGTVSVQQQNQSPVFLSFDDVATISDHVFLTDADMILDVVPSLVHKQDGMASNKTSILPTLHFKLIPLAGCLFSIEIFPDSLGFLEVVMSHSNYL
ncbi:hypothetical protein [Rossellomorea aquimaris]|uniref:Uncharacterized protein n=1 Tax=Rossellomorea aquimaris TaxID=189382 RepID=A0A366F147_9BACI|nr:hypothetical protein [Rossellomorea aquimaris]RBP07896.1 hypothetical protein DET59_101264 [Rossellomorea aquimaris]